MEPGIKKRASEIRGCKVSRNQVFEVPKFQGFVVFEVSRIQGLRFSRYLSFEVSKFWNL
jgi:hypothetical protein